MCEKCCVQWMIMHSPERSEASRTAPGISSAAQAASMVFSNGRMIVTMRGTVDEVISILTVTGRSGWGTPD